MRIDIGVGGKFHADQLFRGLASAHHDVHLYTSYPRSRFGQIPSGKIHPFLFPEISYRLASKLGYEQFGDLFKMRSFGSRMARYIDKQKQSADFFFGWSSFSLETLKLSHAQKKIILRDSAHILFQNEILKEAYDRLGLVYPDRQICENREIEEYDLADTIFVLSDFAKRSFEERGISASKLFKLPLGVDLTRFQPNENHEYRLPIKVIYFGNISIQKGIHHLLEATKKFSKGEVELTLVGAMEPAMEPLCRKYPAVRIEKPMEQTRLASFIRDFDVFVFPTLHDGFGQTLLQAMASGLIPIVSENCGAADYVNSGYNGWVVPVADANAIESKLSELVADISMLGPMRDSCIKTARGRSWQSYHEELNNWMKSQANG